MRCYRCDYSLKGLTGPPHRCPECGREFDPNDPTTFDDEAFSEAEAGAARAFFISCGWVAVLLLILVLVSVLRLRHG